MEARLKDADAAIVKLSQAVEDREVLIAAAAPVVAFVQKIACMEGDELEANCSVELRDAARGTFKTEADWRPSYSDEARAVAAETVRQRAMTGTIKSSAVDVIVGYSTADAYGDTVDAVAQALGMRRAEA